jgi:hypothetical protein
MAVQMKTWVRYLHAKGTKASGQFVCLWRESDFKETGLFWRNELLIQDAMLTAS